MAEDKVCITFVEEDLAVNAKSGTKLMAIVKASGADVTFGCKAGTCGTCRVRVVQGASQLLPMKSEEQEFLAAMDAQADERLACQVTVLGDCALEYIGK